MIYVGVVLLVSLLSSKARLSTGFIVVVAALMLKFLVLLSEQNVKISVAFHLILLMVALDRQAKDAG